MNAMQTHRAAKTALATVAVVVSGSCYGHGGDNRAPSPPPPGLVALAGAAAGAASGPGALADRPNDAEAVAWVRFTDGAEQYRGIPYHWLGRQELRITFDIAPRAGHALELLWGSKNDLRAATLAVNGQPLHLEGGGFDGFRWLRVPLPPGLQGERYDLILQMAGRAAAFLGEVRLTAPKGDPARPDLKQPAYKARVASGAALRTATAIEAFPDMRKVWDREPPPASPLDDAQAEKLFRQAERNARLANEALYRSRRFVDGWLARADPATGLIPRNLNPGGDFWNGRDAGADNYAFMVLTAAITDPPLLQGRMLEMLRTEQRLTARLDRLADDYSFPKKGWRREKFDLDATIFDSVEYVKDGLLYIAEWLGKCPWSDRMIGLIEDVWKHAPIQTPFGTIPTRNFEVNGDLLQACSRLYWFTGQRQYLDWATRLGDYYLLGTNHPTRHAQTLALSDHSCEMINGLSELYVAVAKAAPDKKKAYEAPLRELYDRILELGCNEHGLMYGWVRPRTGERGGGLTDNWGYNYDGLYTAWLIDGTGAYRDAVRRALGNLKEHYTGQVWQGGTADGYADSIEGAITLFKHEPVPSAADWIDSEIRTMWAKQQADGVIEGWHGDGNFARTSLMYALWKTQGVTAQPWRADLRFGATRGVVGQLCLSLVADQPWEGKLVFDRPRHKEYMRLPLDYPRINQFPEWFVVGAAAEYSVRQGPVTPPTSRRGQELLDGLPVRLSAGQEQRWTIEAR